MSLIFIDSFDYDTDDINYKYQRSGYPSDNVSISTTITRRTGAKSLNLGSTLSTGGCVRPFGGGVYTAIMGMATYFDTPPTGVVTKNHFDILMSSLFFRVSVGTDYSLRLSYSTTEIDASIPSVMFEKTWQYIEVKIVSSPSSADVNIIVKINGVEVINYSGTQGTSGQTATAIDFDPNYQRNQYFQDLYICDNSSSINNDFLGDIRVEILRPNANGSENDFTPSAGSNYENVDEVPVDEDVTYNESAVVSDRDLYAMADISATGADILGVQHQSIIRKDDANIRYGKQLFKSGSTEIKSSEITLNDTYTPYHQVFDEDPNTSTAWTEAGVNGVQSGVEVTA